MSAGILVAMRDPIALHSPAAANCTAVSSCESSVIRKLSDCVFQEPNGVYHGRDEIDHVAGKIKATHPDFRNQVIAEPEELGDAGRLQWVSGLPGEAPAYAGTDFIIARDGRIAALYLFFDKLP